MNWKLLIHLQGKTSYEFLYNLLELYFFWKLEFLISGI